VNAKKDRKDEEITIDCQIAQCCSAIVLNILVCTTQKLDKNRKNPFADQKGTIIRCKGNSGECLTTETRKKEKKRSRKAHQHVSN